MRQIERQKDQVPKEVLRGADFVEGDKGKGLGEEGRWKVVSGEREGQEEGGEEELGEECEPGEIE